MFLNQWYMLCISAHDYLVCLLSLFQWVFVSFRIRESDLVYFSLLVVDNVH